MESDVGAEEAGEDTIEGTVTLNNKTLSGVGKCGGGVTTETSSRTGEEA